MKNYAAMNKNLLRKYYKLYKISLSKDISLLFPYYLGQIHENLYF